ncbi:hypothetical protein JL09_g2512 [Pichia kudriavzevii]|uniref:Striatin N-terminal domain-containing protein n=1 Tax=Pichia kudriavzevii TaxID=4909 RepID=A0A099P2A1_PICKU|nr:hypothetical protein JL09_g2512 [Pichia kudriavzevii]
MQNGQGRKESLSDPASGVTANYTLPGIMQYLQSQFTQVERNRLQGELERSSLKMKIIELENDRNMLIRKNERLEGTIEQLKLEISQLKGTDPSSSAVSEKDLDVLEGIHSVDVSKLVEAKKFLKDATNEILYLLQTPNNKENFTAFTPISDGKLSGIGEGMLSIKGYGAFHFDLGKNGQTLKISNDAYTVSTKTIHSLELLHLDTCGSISVPSLNGERHCLSIVDIYIRWTSIVPVMSKDQTSIEIERFILFAENHFHSTGFAVGKVRSNNGGEFCNKELDGYF